MAEVDSFLRAHTVYGKHPLDQAGRDLYVEQSALVARKLGVIDPPTTEAELDAQLAAFRPELRGTPEAREAVPTCFPPAPAPGRPGAVRRAGRRRRGADAGLDPAAAAAALAAGLRAHRGAGARHLATGTIRWALTPREGRGRQAVGPAPIATRPATSGGCPRTAEAVQWPDGPQ